MEYTNCRLCGSSTFPRKGQIRSTRPILADKILECSFCSFVFLNDDSHISKTHYEESLMHDYEKTLEDSRDESKEEDIRRYNMLKSEILNKNIIEVGVGNGGFLKLAQKVAKTVQGIEPEKKHYKTFEAERLNITPNINDLNDFEEADIVVCFHVIEHLNDPLGFLLELLNLLKINKKIFIETPNSNDALITLYDSEAFQNFTYWDNHLVLFNNKSFEFMCHKISGIKYKSIPVQRFSIANHLHWLAKKKPGGHKSWSFLDEELIKNKYREKLFELQMNDTLFYEITKISDQCKLKL